MPWLRPLIIIVPLLLALACSSSGKRPPDQEEGEGAGGAGGAPGKLHAKLAIKVVGLPEGLKADLVLTTPDEKQIVLRGSTTFDIIAPGDYQLRAPAVIPADYTYYVSEFRGARFELEAGGEEEVEIRYERLPYSVRFDRLLVPWRGEQEMRARILREPDFNGHLEVSISELDSAFTATPGSASLPANESELRFRIRNTGPLISVEPQFGLTLVVDEGHRAFGFRFLFDSLVIVTTENDDGPGSLREILELAEEVPHPREVYFESEIRRIPLGSPLAFHSTRPLNIVGHDAWGYSTQISPPSSSLPPRIWLQVEGEHRALEVRGDLRVRNLGFQGGEALRGGCIHNRGTLRLESGVWLSECKAEFGGAIANAEGSLLEIMNSNLSWNQSREGGAIYLEAASKARIAESSLGANLAEVGGAVLSRGELHLLRSSFVSNSASLGGALGSYGGLLDEGSTYARNSALGNCGAFLHLGPGEARIEGSTFTENHATDGGAICAGPGSELAIQQASFEANRARLGGAVFSEGANLAIEGSTFDSNLGVEGGGAVAALLDTSLRVQTSHFQANEGDLGGAIFAEGTAQVFRSAFFENQGREGGAIHASRLLLENSSLASNRASESGGALFLREGLMDLRFSTLVVNEAAQGGGIYAEVPFLSIGACILAQNEGDDLYFHLGEGGQLFSEGFNLVGALEPAFREMMSEVDEVGSPDLPLDPVISHLSSQGPPSFSLHRRSPAVDAVPIFYCEKLLSDGLVDQRGSGRPRGGACDAGAVESF